MLPDLPPAPLAPASTPVLPCPSPSMPQPHWPSLSSHPRASVHSRCLRHSGPTLANPPQHPSRLCLNVVFPKKLSLPPTPSIPTSRRSPDCFLSWYLSPLLHITDHGLKSHRHVHFFICLSKPVLFNTATPEAVKHLKHT